MARQIRSARALVYNNLSTMLDSGVPLVRSLQTAVSSLRGKLAKDFRALADQVLAGHSIAETMVKYPRSFSRLDVLMVKAGETSGDLPECLKLLADWYTFRDKLKNIIISGMFLPLVLIHIAAFAGLAPALFLGVIKLHEYFLQVLTVLAIFYIPAMVILAFMKLLADSGILRKCRDSLLLKIPFLAEAVKQLALSRYCRVFYMLFEAGVPIMQCAQKASEMTGNIYVADMLKGGADSARAGNPVFEGFSGQLPKEFLDNWRIGEQSGTLDNVLCRLADNTGEAAERIITRICRWIPILIYYYICVQISLQIMISFRRMF